MRRLLTLLAVVGVTSTGLVLLQMRPDVTVADVLDAGVRGGVATALRCRVRLTDEAVAEAIDAGLGQRLTGRYGEVLVPARRFDAHDAGIFDLPDRLEVYGTTPCEEVLDAGAPERAIPLLQRCACRAAAGTCTIPNPDGGARLPAPFGRTLRAGEWQGAGCQRKPCVEIAGESSWPLAVCPDRDAG